MEKDKREVVVPTLTTEKIKQRFKSQFELVSYAIRLAENMIRSGREPRIKTDIQNKAIQVLGEIACGKDQFDEIIIEQKPVNQTREYPREREFIDTQARSSEKRKARKIFND